MLKNNRGELVAQPHGLGCFQIFSLTLRAETIRSVFRRVRSLGAALDASLSGYGSPLFLGNYWRSRPSRTAAMRSSVCTPNFTPFTSSGEALDLRAGEILKIAPSRRRISTAPSRSASSSTEAKFSRASE